MSIFAVQYVLVEALSCANSSMIIVNVNNIFIILNKQPAWSI